MLVLKLLSIIKHSLQKLSKTFNIVSVILTSRKTTGFVYYNVDSHRYMQVEADIFWHY